MNKTVLLLSVTMGVVVLTSNYLVQFPFQHYGLSEILTYGAFTYPIAFLITDLANRSFGKEIAKLVDGVTKISVFENTAELDALATPEQIAQEREFLQRFRYEWFSVNIGSAPFTGTGSSIKKTTTNTQRQGTAYRIYGCGYMMASNANADEFEDPDIIIPLESVVVLTN